MEQVTKAYVQGAEDYWNYSTMLANPFDSDKMEHSQWEDGFIDARAIDNGDIYATDSPNYKYTENN